MPLQLCIDDPADLQIQRPLCQIRGWYAADSLEDLAGLEFGIAGTRVAHRLVRRPDVEETLPEKSARGFLLDLDLSHHLPGVYKREFILQVITANGQVAELRFRVSREALGKCLETASGA
jgi:hypothetical protein